VKIARLETEKRLAEEELENQRKSADLEKKDALAMVAKFRQDNEQLAINYESTKNELQSLKSNFAALEDKFKRLEDERNSLKALTSAQEQTIKRAGIIINEYVCPNEDGSSAGMSGGEVLQLKADVKRLEELLRQKRSQADAYRHISIEEQRLIATEWVSLFLFN
jgi:predicted nuclease with TOPRIM domain